jgi:multisubunit Na+/H+ antiporter MnhG subunit
LSIGAFLMLTSPVSTHVIARAAYLTHVPLWKGTIVNEWHLDEKSPREEPDDHSQRGL